MLYLPISLRFKVELKGPRFIFVNLTFSSDYEIKRLITTSSATRKNKSQASTFIILLYDCIIHNGTSCILLYDCIIQNDTSCILLYDCIIHNDTSCILLYDCIIHNDTSCILLYDCIIHNDTSCIFFHLFMLTTCFGTIVRTSGKTSVVLSQHILNGTYSSCSHG
jgi:hypothetical protein